MHNSKYHYEIFKEYCISRHRTPHKVYGIKITSKTEQPRYIHYIAEKPEKLYPLIDMFNKNQLSPIHIIDALNDFKETFYHIR